MNQPVGIDRRTLLSGAAGASGLLALTACGADRSDRPGAKSSTGSVSPKRGGHLKAAFVGGSNESPSVLLALMTGITMVRGRAIWDTLGEVSGGRPKWRVAESVEPNSDATEWTVRVRRGIEFSDGSPLTAKDVASSLAGFMAGKTEQASMLANVKPKAIRVKDPHTVVIPLKTPDGLFAQTLAQSMFIYPHSTTDPTKALGSGPFVSKSFRSGQGAVLERNPNYWGDKGPYLDTLELVSIADNGARYNGVKSGQYDYASNISLTAARAERNNPDLTLVVPPRDLWSGVLLFGNATVAPFTDPQVRRALHYSFDREALAKTVALGIGGIGNDLLSPGDAVYANDIAQFDYDPDRTKSMLRKAGHQGLRVKLATTDGFYGLLETATAWVDQAKSAGVTVALDKIAANDYYTDIPRLLHSPMAMNPATAFPLGQSYQAYYGASSPYPFSGLAKQAEPLMTALQHAIGEPAQRAAAHKLQEWVTQHAAQYMPVRLPSVSLSTKRVHGVEAAGFAEYPVFREAFLA